MEARETETDYLSFLMYQYTSPHNELDVHDLQHIDELIISLKQYVRSVKFSTSLCNLYLHIEIAHLDNVLLIGTLPTHHFADSCT